MGKAEIELVLEEFFTEREGNGVLEELRGMDLVADGLLDSIDAVILATFLEEKISVNLDITTDSALTAMRSFDGLVNLINKQLNTITD